MRPGIGTSPVAPGLRVGRGLEHAVLYVTLDRVMLRPAFGSGEDWNIARKEEE